MVDHVSELYLTTVAELASTSTLTFHSNSPKNYNTSKLSLSAEHMKCKIDRIVLECLE